MSPFAAFTRHPASVGESYVQHFRAAGGFAFALFAAAVCCAVHAVFPFLCEKSGSRAVENLHRRMAERQRPGRGRAPSPQAGNAVGVQGR